MIDYSAVVEAIRARLQELAGFPVVVAPLPPSGGVAIAVSSGGVLRDMAGNVFARLSVRVNAKDSEQIDALNALSGAHDVLKDLAGETDGWQLTGVSIRTTPAVNLDPSGNYVTVSTIEARVVFWR